MANTSPWKCIFKSLGDYHLWGHFLCYLLLNPLSYLLLLTGIQELGDDSICILETQKSSLPHYRIRPQKLQKQTFLSLPHEWLCVNFSKLFLEWIVSTAITPKSFVLCIYITSQYNRGKQQLEKLCTHNLTKRIFVCTHDSGFL